MCSNVLLVLPVGALAPHSVLETIAGQAIYFKIFLNK
jgi:hypothetical protein